MADEMDEVAILNSIGDFGAIDEETVRRDTVNHNQESIRKWLEASFPRIEKYRFSSIENGKHVRSYPPEFSGSVVWYQGCSRGQFRLVQRNLIFNSDLRYIDSSEEQRYVEIVLDVLPVSLSLEYSKESVGFQFMYDAIVTIRIPKGKPGDSPEWSVLGEKNGLERSFVGTQDVWVPYDLLDSWRKGELQSSSHEITEKDSQYIDYGEYRYPYGLYRWFHSLGTDPLGVLQRADCMDEDTLGLIRAKLEEPHSIVSRVQIKSKDRERLRILAKVEGENEPLSTLQLARLLSYDGKGGAHAFKRRMQGLGLIEVKKGPGGIGALIKLTPAGRSVL